MENCALGAEAKSSHVWCQRPDSTQETGITVSLPAGQYRVINLTTHGKTIYVLHAFRKKTRKTRQSDIKLARDALSQLMHRNMS
jgi:phage-related protein